VKDTFAKSCDSAAAAIVSQLSTTIVTDSTITSTGNITTHTQKSAGKLMHFMVLDIWIDPATRAVWTLAIAQSGE
jgi:hypothetical protein